LDNYKIVLLPKSVHFKAKASNESVVVNLLHAQKSKGEKATGKTLFWCCWQAKAEFSIFLKTEMLRWPGKHHRPGASKGIYEDLSDSVAASRRDSRTVCWKIILNLGRVEGTIIASNIVYVLTMIWCWSKQYFHLLCASESQYLQTI